MEGAFIRWNERSLGRGELTGYILDGSGCHIWLGQRNHAGYPGAWDPQSRRQRNVTRVRYEREIGPIPEGMALDHYVCDNGPGGCCNPLHCRPVSHRENTLRSNSASARNLAKTACPRGHPLEGENLVQHRAGRGQRRCRACDLASRRKAAGRGSARVCDWCEATFHRYSRQRYAHEYCTPDCYRASLRDSERLRKESTGFAVRTLPDHEGESVPALRMVGGA